MSLIEDIQHLTDQKDWVGIVTLAADITTFIAPRRDRALAIHALSRAHWALSRDAFDLAAAVRYAREAARLDNLQGRSLKTLGSFLVTIGRYGEGTRVMHNWLARYHEWSPEFQAHLADVQYNLGYAAQYQREFDQAALWYTAALQTYTQASNAQWMELTSCALAQVLAIQGRTESARIILDNVSTNAAYRLKALTEIYAAEGNNDAALLTGEDASEALMALNDDDPWELAELHVLLADLHMQAGNHSERDKHLEHVMCVLRCSPRHDLYTVARLLLERDREEVG